MARFEARGTYGEVRKGYHVVARLESWALDENGRLEASRATDVNRFWLDQGGPFAVRLQFGKKFWAWREADVLDASAPFVLRVNGSPEVRA